MKKIAVLPGDGIGPEVTAEGLRVLREIGGFEIEEALVGGAAMDATGEPLPKETLELCRGSDAVLLGAVGGPKWDRPERGLLAIRKELGLYANLRPVKPHPRVQESPIKPEILRGVDFVFVRELTGGIYFGEKTRTQDSASDTCTYSVEEITRITVVACELARKRKKKLTSIDKSNVLETSRLWRETVDDFVKKEYPDLELEHLLVDAAAMHLLKRPRDFDVLVTENMFGDILSDEASMLTGSLGMLPSASLGDGSRGLYEPVHGSAPDIAGKGIANPYGMILSVAMMLRHSLGMAKEAEEVENAVTAALDASGMPKKTSDAGEAVLAALSGIA